MFLWLPILLLKLVGQPATFLLQKTQKTLFVHSLLQKGARCRFLFWRGGSNILVSDKGFPGLVIKIQNTKYKILNTKVYAQAGVDFPMIVQATGKRGLAGLEWAGGLPGSVGGAVRGNAGAFGGEVKDSLVFAEVLNGQGKIKKLTKKQCRFSYRSSVFKEKNWIVLSATFQLQKDNKKTIQDIAKEHIRYRKEKHPLEYPNAGSIFKNCSFAKFSKKMQKELSFVVKVDPFPVIPTAYLIAQAGLKGTRIGKAEVSKKHPNYMVNLGGACAKDVLLLIEKVKKDIKKKFSITLEQEIQYVS